MFVEKKIALPYAKYTTTRRTDDDLDDAMDSGEVRSRVEDER